MNHLTKRCGCGSIFNLVSLRDRATTCPTCDRKAAARMEERRERPRLEWYRHPLAATYLAAHDLHIEVWPSRHPDDGRGAWRWSAETTQDQSRVSFDCCDVEPTMERAKIAAERAAGIVAMCLFAWRATEGVRERKWELSRMAWDAMSQVHAMMDKLNYPKTVERKFSPDRNCLCRRGGR